MFRSQPQGDRQKYFASLGSRSHISCEHHFFALPLSGDFRLPRTFRPETREERMKRLAADAPKALADYQAERRAVDVRTAELRALRLAKEASEAAEPGQPQKKKKKASAKPRRAFSQRDPGP
jgi:hypothetical protein